MNCPKCNAQFASQIFKDHFQYEVCPDCEGRWIGGAVLHDFCDSFFHCGKEKVFEHFMAQPLKPTRIPCPGCRKNLTLVASNNIEVEFCVACNGVFFDAGEMLKAMPQGKYDLSMTENKAMFKEAKSHVFGEAIKSIIGRVLF